MANSLTNVTDKILARGLMVLREAAVMPRLVNLDYSTEARMFGTTVDIPVPAAQVASTVAASHELKAPASKTPTLVQIPLNQWKMTDFHMTDKEMVEVERNRHFVPGQTGAAAKVLANTMDTHIHNQYKTIYGYVGTAAVTPFSTVKSATDVRKVLNEQLAPMSDRRVVLDPAGEAQALQLSAYSDLEKTGDRAVKIEGELGRKFGMDHFMSQNVVTHTAGTQVSAQVASTTATGATALDIKSPSTGDAGTILFGDIFTIAGDTQTYVYNSSATITLVSTIAQSVSIDPALKVIASANSAIQFKRTHVVNLGFTREAFAFAQRPLAERVMGMTGGNPIRQLTDDVTGLTLRLEIVRQHKQDAWQFDVLYGAKLVRPEFATRIAG